MNIDLINSIEAILYGAGRPITLSEIRNILSNNNESNFELSAIKKALNNSSNKNYYFLEFGVWEGRSANFFSKYCNKLHVFDSFSCLLHKIRIEIVQNGNTTQEGGEGSYELHIIDPNRNEIGVENLKKNFGMLLY